MPLQPLHKELCPTVQGYVKIIAAQKDQHGWPERAAFKEIESMMGPENGRKKGKRNSERLTKGPKL